MGRPINKRFFGNLTSPYQDQATGGPTGEGGEGVASISVASPGSININDSYPNFPELVVNDPDLSQSTTATTAVTWEVDTVTITTGTGYTTGTITSITGLDTFSDVLTRFTVTAPGGVPTFNTFTNRGEYTNISGIGIATWNVIGPTGTDAQATVKFRVKSIAVTNTGSGYTAVPGLSWTTLSGTAPSGQTPTLTSVTQNAIAGVAYIPGGSEALPFDIMKQEASRRYLVRTYDGQGQCKLVAAAPNEGEMTIIATDVNSSTYYVTKLTAHRATLAQKTNVGGFEYDDGAVAGWSLDPASMGVVSIANA